MPKLSKQLVTVILQEIQGKFHLNDIRRELENKDVTPGDATLRSIMRRLVEERLIKSSGDRDGWYRKIAEIEPIKWWNGYGVTVPLVWPYGIEDNSSFGFDDSIELYNGESIVIAGDNNWGKSCFVHNLMANNIDLFDGVRLMVNEFNPDRFRDRMSRINWVELWDGDKPKFELLPVTSNWEDYIKPGHLNIIDWVLLRGEFWLIADVIQKVQLALEGKGVAAVVLQKTAGKELGTGGDWGKFLPAAYLTIHRPGKLVVERVKSAKPSVPNPQFKVYAFEIVDRGVKFHNIREVDTCRKCKGYGQSFGTKCDACYGKGYKEKEV